MGANRKSWMLAVFGEGLLILILGTRVYLDLVPGNKQNVIWSFLIAAIFITLGLLSLTSNSIYSWLDAKLGKIGRWFEISTLQFCLFGTSLIFTVLTMSAAGFGTRMNSPLVAIIAWLIGISCAGLGAWNCVEKFPALSVRTLFWSVIVTVFAFIWRGFFTGEIPILLSADEAAAGISAVDFATGRWNNIFVSSWFSFPSLFPAIQSIGVQIWGNNVEALRIPSAVVGALTVGVVYLFGKAMFGQRAGLFAACILAALHVHIHFSRLGINNIWDSLWFTLTLASVWYGWKTNTRWAYILAGLSLGFSQYFYASGKALPLILLVMVILAFTFQRMRFIRSLPDFTVTLVVALTVVMPLLLHYLHDPELLLAQFTRVSFIGETRSPGFAIRSYLLHQLPASLGAYTFTESVAYYLPGIPILRPLASVFFYLGLTFLIFKDRDSRSVTLASWLLLFAFVSSWSAGTPAVQRFVASAPACALLVGYGLDKAGRTLTALIPRMSRIIGVVSYLVLAMIVIGDLLFYFVEYTSFAEMDEAVSTGMTEYRLGTYLTDQPEGTQFVVFGRPWLSHATPTVLYLAPQVRGFDAPEDWDTFDESQLTADRIIFVFLPEYQSEIDLIRNTYPDGTLLPLHSNGGLLFWVYELPTK